MSTVHVVMKDIPGNKCHIKLSCTWTNHMCVFIYICMYVYIYIFLFFYLVSYLFIYILVVGGSELASLEMKALAHRLVPVRMWKKPLPQHPQMKSKGPICILSGPVPAVLLHQCLGQVSGGGFVPRELKDLQGFWLCLFWSHSDC